VSFRGLDQLRARVPDLRSPVRRLVVGLIGIASFAAATVVMLTVDLRWPSWTLLGQFGVVIVAYLLVSQFFWQKARLQTRYGDMAYRNAFGAYVLTGLPMEFAAIAHTAYLPGERAVTGGAALVLWMIGFYLLATGLVLWARAVFTFGADNLAMLYVYFPAEGRIVDSSIYGLIRHPTYSAVVRLGMTLGLWRGTWCSIAFALFMPIGLTIYLRLVEEPDLIERFGEGYANYRQKVPAFVLRLRDAGRFYRFLVSGK
jgi:protein-S-isoprenylcysteine O-methyltransferase Ste14